MKTEESIGSMDVTPITIEVVKSIARIERIDIGANGADDLMMRMKIIARGNQLKVKEMEQSRLHQMKMNG